jgi:S-layer protein
MGALGSFTGGDDNDVFVVTTVANGNLYSTIEDLTAGDKIDFMDNGAHDNDMLFNEDMIELADTAAFADYLAAASSVSAGENDLELSWFQFQGNTFLVVDNSATDAFVNGTDQIVKITGLVDLSDSTIITGGTNVLTIV